MYMDQAGTANPFPSGSPGGSPTAAGVVMSGEDVAQRMLAAVEAAAAAAQAATQAVQTAQASMRPATDVKSWWKLLPKPPTFDHSSRESEIAGMEGMVMELRAIHGQH